MSRLSQPLPKLLVLDLDWTVWKGDCGVNFMEPFTASSTGVVFDAYYRRVRLFPEVQEILAEFHAAGVKIAFASRNQGYSRCRQLLEAFDLWSYAEVLLAMSSGSSNNKDPHFKILTGTTGIEYKDMLFVDDLPQNIDGARKLGVVSVLCDHMKGLCWDRIDSGLAEYQTRVCGFPPAPKEEGVYQSPPAPKEEVPPGLLEQKENEISVSYSENEWTRHKKWSAVCENLSNVDFYQARRDWWHLMYRCEPSRMCRHDCVTLTECYHGKLI
jgi:magnesium-dependent phosphatase-1